VPEAAQFGTISGPNTAVAQALIQGHLANVRASVHRDRRVYFVNAFGDDDFWLDSATHFKFAKNLVASWGYVPITLQRPTRDQLIGAFEDPDSWGVVFAGHGTELGAWQLNRDTYFGPWHVQYPSANLRLVWSLACFAKVAEPHWAGITRAKFYGTSELNYTEEIALATESPWLLNPFTTAFALWSDNKVPPLLDALDRLPHREWHPLRRAREPSDSPP
jgi:hypothetical protein